MPTSLWSEDPVSFSPTIQHDTYSCGVIILSTIAAIILSILAWEPQDAAVFRLFWFIWSAHPHFTLVSLLLLQFQLIDQP